MRVPAKSQVLLRLACEPGRRVWAITLAYSVGAVVLGLTLPRVESRWLPDVASPMSAAAAIAIDSSVASGMITLTGIVFALAFVVVQFGAVAYSPRLVTWIARDRLFMHSIGVFTATFLYSVAELAWVDRLNSGRVPVLSTLAVGILLLASVGTLVGLVYRISRLDLQSVLVSTAERGRDAIDRLYPSMDTDVRPPLDRELIRTPATRALVHTGQPRTLQAVDTAALVRCASNSGAVIQVVCSVGDSVRVGSVLIRVYGTGLEIDERLLEALKLGGERTFEQNPTLAIRLLVDIAVRALSPAVNDPSTAVQVLDHIEDLLVRLGQRRLEIGDFCDCNGRLCLVMPCPKWEDFLTLALEEIRCYGATSVQVMRRMRALTGGLIEALPVERHREVRREQDRLQAIINRTFKNDEEILLACVEDRQGLGAPCARHAGPVVSASRGDARAL